MSKKLDRGGGRDRFRRDYPSRYEDNKGNGVSGRDNRSNNPPSRHLWVGNLSHSIVEEELAHPFLRFGPLENVAFQSGRSYAFVNFRRDEDAIDAMRALQGFTLAGNPLRIEFAKADKSSAVPRDEDYSWDERNSTVRGSPFSQREFRGHHGSPGLQYSDKSKLSDKNPEPSEVLWIGFPAQLKVDESILKKAFSPFGEIMKITTFPGRSYAFVRFRSLTSACRAKDNLKGKLFGNPRVHICFAKSETGSSNSERRSLNGPRSPIYKSSGRDGSSDNLRQDRSFNGDRSIGSPNQFRNWDSDPYDHKRGSSWMGGTNTYEQRKVGEKGRTQGVSQEIYELMNSPSRERDDRFPQKGAFYEDLRAFTDVHYLREAKRPKTGSPPLERELPEYPFSELEKQKQVLPRLLSDLPAREPFDKGFDVGNFTYGQTLERPPNSPLPRLDRQESWKSYDNFQMGSGAQQLTYVEKKRFTPEPDSSSLTEWKWEGTIAKGGTPVCRARCFPVGKVLDIMLPEFLDCTARTGLDMLSKHYYQAVGVWVVFFVPGSDADMEFYNEFMHYLEEKQRAAVAKLDDKTTLFLVPPSEFSEKVLKVPGKLSISGVILRLENPVLNHGPGHMQREMTNENLLSYNENILHLKSSFPLERVPTSPSISELGNSGISNLSFLGNKFAAAPSVSDSVHAMATMSESHDERNRNYPVQQRTSGPNWSSQNLQNFSSRTQSLQASGGTVEHVADERQLTIPRSVTDVNSIQHSSGTCVIPFYGDNKLSYPDIRHLDPLSVPVGALPPEQLAQLAASLLEQQRQSGSSSSTSALADRDPRQINRFNTSDISSRFSTSDTSSRQSQKYATENNLVSSDLSTSQLGQILQMQKQQQISNAPQMSQMVQREPQRESTGNQLVVTDSSLQEDSDSDPQKRLQATLQLAAVLLQQIQQGKGS
ncbi:flowering time control protein FPA [Vigna radiata var. radiata]|uniref:Flowering time control protein FPA n=1 Tax=Vigna radiata var. radiata TaxID=3916 RepID=A0A1S3VIW7_VIGRR|nr:flowering time control protein FPA [Vigna radiata var. radiata]